MITDLPRKLIDNLAHSLLLLGQVLYRRSLGVFTLPVSVTTTPSTDANIQCFERCVLPQFGVDA